MFLTQQNYEKAVTAVKLLEQMGNGNVIIFVTHGNTLQWSVGARIAGSGHVYLKYSIYFYFACYHEW